MTAATAPPTSQHRWIDRAGIFRGRCAEASMISGAEGSQSLGLHVVYDIEESLNGSGWDDWRDYAVRASGTLWIIGKDGAINENAATTARDILGWNGDLKHVNAELNPAQLNVKEDTYEGKTRYRIEWFNPYDHSPGPRKLEAGDLAKAETTHGAKLRAFFGQRRSTAAAPAGRPAPPTASSPPAPAPSTAPEATTSPDVPQVTTRDEAWTHVLSVYNGDQDKATKQWQHWVPIIASKVGRSEAKFHAGDWQRVAMEAEIPV